MGYYVHSNDVREFKYSSSAQLTAITVGLDEVDTVLSQLILNPSMDGAGADSIYTYLYEMILNTIPIISTVMLDFMTKMTLFEAGNV